MPDLGEEILMNELIHSGQKNAKSRMGVVPTDDDSLVIGIHLS